MIKLSFWAKQHPAKARAVIILLHILLNALAVYTACNLFQLRLSVPSAVMYTTVLFFLSAVLVYPSRQQKNKRFNKRHLYLLRKSCDFVLGACSFIIVCFAVNSYAYNNINTVAFSTAAAVYSKGGEKPGAAAILASLAQRDKSTLTRSEKRILKKEFNRQLKEYVKAKLTRDEEATEKAILIILSIIAAVGLTFLLAGLACNIACNGSEAAAILVSILGLTAIIFLLVLVIKKIKKHKKQQPAVPQQ
ncbi:MAG: hypothetical protein ABIQ88_15515 [Chitinophagaceae bacterium]